MFNWSFPYPSQRMPVLAKNVVATSQPLAAQAGVRLLMQGGNAILGADAPFFKQVYDVTPEDEPAWVKPGCVWSGQTCADPARQ